jgi:hypothetical protein
MEGLARATRQERPRSHTVVIGARLAHRSTSRSPFVSQHEAIPRATIKPAAPDLHVLRLPHPASPRSAPRRSVSPASPPPILTLKTHRTLTRPDREGPDKSARCSPSGPSPAAPARASPRAPTPVADDTTNEIDKATLVTPGRFVLLREKSRVFRHAPSTRGMEARTRDFLTT